MTTPANPLVAQPADSPSPWAGVWIAEDIDQIVTGVRDGSWIEGTLGVAGGGLDALAMVSDPVGALLQYGIAWLIEHVKPLSEALDWLAGDPGAIAAQAQTWRNVAASLAAEAEELGRAVRWDTTEWTGAAADAYRTWAGHREQSMAALGQAASGMALMTEGAGLLIGTVRLMVRDAVATVVSRLIVYAGELVASLGSLTGLVVEQVTTLCASWGAKIARWLKDLIASLRKLLTESDRLSRLIEKLREMLRGKGAPSARGPDPDLRATGGELRRPRDEFDFEITWADRAYDSIRSTDDVAEVVETARRYGFDEEDVRTVKNHVFDKEQVLDLWDDEPPRTARFDSNPRIAEAWMRLRDGNPHPEDITWFKHEQYEARYMADTGDPSYRRAHDATKAAGLTWDGEAAAADGYGYQRR